MKQIPKNAFERHRRVLALIEVINVKAWHQSQRSQNQLDSSGVALREVVVQLAQDALGYESAKATLKEKNSAFAFR